MPRFLLLVAVCALAVACSEPAGPPLSISNIVILEPLPGAGTAAAYLEIENRSAEPLTINSITSPQFGRIEMHETVIENDIARMRAIKSLTVAEHSRVQFAPGGKHLMLFDPRVSVAAGTPVTIDFYDDGNGLISVATTIRSRTNFKE